MEWREDHRRITEKSTIFLIYMHRQLACRLPSVVVLLRCN
jgi:hypothetical protein